MAFQQTPLTFRGTFAASRAHSLPDYEGLATAVG
jgi:hypothetical protein